MARYLILGAGKFGRLALERLARLDKEARFLVVDRSPGALAAAKGLGHSQGQWVEAEAAAFLAENLGNGVAWDWLIPMIPEHVAFSWLRRSLLRGPDWEVRAVPEELANLAPVVTRGREGELYVSRAAHLCPDDCSEPRECPVTGEARDSSLFAELAGVAMPGFRMAVIPSLQLAPGVGGYPPERLTALPRDLAGFRGKLLIATACRCHGVVHALERRAGD